MPARFIFIIISILPFAASSRIVFPTSQGTRRSSCYLPQHNTHGICVRPENCKLYQLLTARSKFSEILCDKTNPKIICCPENLDLSPAKQIDISQPSSAYEDCGSIFEPGFSTPLTVFYRANDTATRLEEEGFTISGIEMDFEDKLYDFNFSNDTFDGNFILDFGVLHFALGGIDARRIVTVYMALLGEKSDFTNSVNWLCDGVLVNFEWVLTAAHCFSANLNTVRLGEYNLTTTEPSDNEDPQDYGIKKVVIYPKYKFPAAYHDLALVQLSRRTYVARNDINPICLPWGEEANVPLTNKQVTLTGWGATFFGGPTSTIPQEVNVTVFDVSKCEKGYSTLRDYGEKFPSGMKSHPILCAGDEAGGKDACQGDSGAPIVYLNDNGRFTLAGIVSTGHGCGLKDFPGIYTTIAVPEHLNWIKTTAFSSDATDLFP